MCTCSRGQFFVFFFQAEDGIRDLTVTGVQTCALPISISEREFRTCVNLDPNNGEALNYRGRTLIFMSRLPEAIEVLRKAVTLPLYATPDKAYVNLGWALHQQGDIPGAIRVYQEALKIEDR